MALVSMLLLSKARVLQELSVPYRQGAGWERQPTRHAWARGLAGASKSWGRGCTSGGSWAELGLPACPVTNLKLPEAGHGGAQTTDS